MAVQTKRSNTPSKPQEKMRYGAAGVIVGKVKSVEFLKWGDREVVKLRLMSGQTEVRANSTREDVLTTLDGVLEGDEIGLFGFFSSRLDRDDPNKVWSDFRIHRVDIADIKGPSKITLFGKFVQSAKTGWGTLVDIDISDRPDYPTLARVVVPDDVEMADFNEDDEIKCLARPSGKFGDMTVYQFLDPTAEYMPRSNGVSLGTEKLDRFRRNGRSEVTRTGESTDASPAPVPASASPAPIAVRSRR